MSLYAEFNNNISQYHGIVEPLDTSSSARHIMLLNEDLPEVMMEKMEIKKRGSDTGIIKLKDGEKNQQFVDSSLLSSLVVQKRTHSFIDDVNFDFLQVVLTGCLCSLFLICLARIYIIKIRNRRVIPREPLLECDYDADDSYDASESLQTELTPSEEFLESNNCETDSVPLLQELTLLQEVTRL